VLFSTIVGTDTFVDSKIFFVIPLDFSFGFKNTSISGLEISKLKEIKIDFLNLIV